MKRIFDARSHGVLDYLAVVAFAVGPSVFKLGSTASKVSYGLAVIHFLVTIFSRFPLGIFKKLSLVYHAAIEFWASVGILIYGGVFLRSTDRLFFVAMGVIILAAFMLTDYTER